MKLTPSTSCTWTNPTESKVRRNKQHIITCSQQNTPKQSVGQTAVPPSVDHQGVWIPSSCFGARLRFAPRARAARALSIG